MTEVSENRLIEILTRGMARHPLQLNALQESDAELLRLPRSNSLLAVTTDSIVEELERGLYSDPYQIGWMTVTVNASDLAAVGAEPLGILINETIPPDLDEDFLSALQRGIRESCAWYGLHNLGGDTNFSSRVHMSATALGMVTSGYPMTRMGCRPGDVLFASGPLGLGAVFALLQLQPGPQRQRLNRGFLPAARLREGQLARSFATACMDTSDGVIPTLDQLKRMNNIGFKLTARMTDMLHERTLETAKSTGLPEWLFLAGPHGEFELLFTVPPSTRPLFIMTAAESGWEPIEIGEVVTEPNVTLRVQGEDRELDTTTIRNLFGKVGGSIERYIAELLCLAHGAESDT